MERSAGFNRVIRRGYVLIFAFVFIFHTAFSMLPPLLMAGGRAEAAGLIYKYYRLMCHQIPSRSFYLFGTQAYYPLSAGEGSGRLTFDEAAGPDAGRGMDRTFYGNPEMGYKMGICQRDTAIFLGMALFCLIFQMSGCRIPVPRLILAALIGCLPIAADGITQLLGNAFPGIFPFRESNPFLRTVTGGLFGFCLCWYLIPLLEQALRMEDRYARS